jgi:DNA-binding NarL/FixJ family response regulator
LSAGIHFQFEVPDRGDRQIRRGGSGGGERSSPSVVGASPGPADVLVVDDHELVRTAIVAALRLHGVHANSCTGLTVANIVTEAAQQRPGLVLLDLDLGLAPDGRLIDGAAAVAPLCAQGRRVLVVSGSPNNSQVAAAIAAGAIGQVNKSVSFTTLVGVVVDASNGRRVMSIADRHRWLELHRLERFRRRRQQKLLDRLTPRERAVLERLAAGHRANAIAAEFVVTLSTVRSQIRSILTKLEVSSQLEAAALVRR